jgi:hypothetical protein
MKHISITKLTQLDAAIACTQALIAGQQVLIERLDAESGDTSRQREFLATFEGLLAVQQARRLTLVSHQGQLTTWPPISAAPEFRREVS